MRLYMIFKRIIDFVFALILIILTFPILLLCAVLIKFEDPKGSFLYTQERVGKNNTIFKVIKLRSMRIEREKNGHKLSDTERMLKIGSISRKLSLDELPQLINIIKGEMSFIGPRPLPTIYLPYYTDTELHRHDVTPGISGWAQINGRNFLSWDKRFEFDLYYIEKVSFLFDLKILLLTIKKVLTISDVGVRGVDFADVSLHQIREKNTK